MPECCICEKTVDDKDYGYAAGVKGAYYVPDGTCRWCQEKDARDNTTTPWHDLDDPFDEKYA